MAREDRKKARLHAPARSARGLRIALALPAAQAFIERVWLGVLDHAQKAGGWRITMNPEGGGLSLRNLEGWDGDGILAFVESRSEWESASRVRCPLINLSMRIRIPELLTVGSDNFAIGRSAALHLRERGFERFAFYGLKGVWYSQERLRGFRTTLGDAMPLEVLLSRGAFSQRRAWDSDRESLERWVLGLRGAGPVGILAVHDYRAVLLLETARRLGIAVPGEFAVIGVNDDPVACGGSVPALSSVPQDGFAVGARAAGLLQDWILRGIRPGEPELVAPLRVVERASTDMIGVQEPRMRRALDFIERALGRAFGVEEVAAAVGASRRWVEQRFSRQLGISPRDYIVKKRLNRVAFLRAQEPLISEAELSERAGFPSVRAYRAAMNGERQC